MHLIKPLAAALGGGAMATGAYLTKDHWMPSNKEAGDSISKVLVDRKYTPLDPSKAEGWEAVLEKYNAAYSTAAKKVSNLQEECRALLSKEEFNDVDYQKARRWCTKLQSVSDRLGAFNRKALSTTESETKDNDEWKKKINAHNGEHSNKLDHTFTGEDDANLKAIKSKCATLNGKQSTDEGFEKDFSKSFEWCSIE
ncbi:hypothetical protein HF1_11980 [Mycoplasma haemofelis str. Langford 1]|uniref:Uncharacterized protein n=1 Tax=Mycoplasma haemofelis (strain Langford 1) TaxID=941640 RepID=E8ZJ85_MYCHL|nr:hypothetical protein [Mycoplasma haemofelis]CBY93206.1 hypothetical protein HF1_11980 [Mycoplasma haemofelis str. Langford 1]